MLAGVLDRVEAHDEARIVSAAFQATAERGARTIPVSLVANIVELARLLTQQPGQWEIDEKVYARRLFARPNPVFRKRDCDRRIGIIRLLYNVDDCDSLNAKLKLTLRLPTQTFCVWLYRGLAADGLYLAKPVSP